VVQNRQYAAMLLKKKLARQSVWTSFSPDARFFFYLYFVATGYNLPEHECRDAECYGAVLARSNCE
jgi:hypothetical protein